jgi:hypothetical protein
MEKGKLIAYWVFTILMGAGMLSSGIEQLIGVKEMNDILVHLGYPHYLMAILGVWKILGVMAIMVPGLTLVKEWAYAGFFFVMTGALISHLIMGDSGKAILGPLFQTIFITLSWYLRPSGRKIVLVKQAA